MLCKSQQTPSRRIINKKLHKLIQEIQDFDPNLNWGGCGAFAYLLAEQLDKYHIPYTFLVWTPSFMNKDGDDSTEKYGPITKYKLKKYFLTCQHIAIKIHRTVYNDMPHHVDYTYVPRDLNRYVKKNIVESVGFGRQVWNNEFDISNLWKIRNKLNSKFLSCTEQL